jgi:hypothetical protein
MKFFDRGKWAGGRFGIISEHDIEKRLTINMALKQTNELVVGRDFE